MIHLTPAELIAIKRDGGALSKQMIDDVVEGITDMSLSDAQVGAFATPSSYCVVLLQY